MALRNRSWALAWVGIVSGTWLVIAPGVLHVAEPAVFNDLTTSVVISRRRWRWRPSRR